MPNDVLHELSERWERQQEVYLPHRDERFAMMFKLAARLLGPPADPLTILDLACGTGALARRALHVFPDARVVAVDFDPSLLAIARANLDDAGGQISFHELDLRDPTWSEALPVHQFDLVVSATATHWLAAADLVAVYTAVARLLRPGGVLVNADLLPDLGRTSRLHEAVEQLDRDQAGEAVAAGRGENWEQWWSAARAEPDLTDLVAERDRRFAPNLGHVPCSLALHRQTLGDVGFAEVGEIFRYWRDAVIVAIR